MDLPSTPEFLVSEMRVLTMREETFFQVVGQPTAMAGLDGELDALIPKLEGPVPQPASRRLGRSSSATFGSALRTSM